MTTKQEQIKKLVDKYCKMYGLVPSFWGNIFIDFADKYYDIMKESK